MFLYTEVVSLRRSDSLRVCLCVCVCSPVLGMFVTGLQLSILLANTVMKLWVP
jgi:hypothetical protein